MSRDEADPRDLDAPRSATGGWSTGVGLAFVLVVAAWARLTRFQSSLPAGVGVALDGDSDYHVRRILAAIHGAIPTFDPLMNWPAGGACVWADGFDVLGAWFVRLAGASGSRDAAIIGALLWPVVLGLLAVWGTVVLARQFVRPGEEPAALAAGLLVAVVPQFVAISAFGRVDHHVAEALVMVLLTVWVAQRFPAQGGRRWDGWGFEAAGALSIALALWLFAGGVLYVAIAVVPLGVALLAEPRSVRIAGSGAPAMLGGAAMGALLTVPAMRGHGRAVSFVYPSLLQPGLVAMAGVALTAAIVVVARMGARRGPMRAAAALGTALVVSALAWAGSASLRREVIEAIHGWILHGDSWLANIAEFQPLLSPRSPGGGGLSSVDYNFGTVGLLGAVAFPVAIAVAWASGAARALVLAWVTLAIGALALLQVRFGRPAMPFLAVAIALAFLGVARIVRRVAGTRHSLAWSPVLAAVVLVLASPSLRKQLAVYDALDLGPLHRAAVDLRIDRPPRPGGREGVLLPWDHGHTLSVVSGRPVTANGFGTYLDAESFEEVKNAFLGDEKRLVSTMDKYDLGFLVAGGSVLMNHQPQPDVPPAVGEPRVLNPAYMRALPLSQLLIAGSALPGADLPQLEELMPVFASKAVAGSLGFPLPVAWTYERVRGAVLVGRAAPGSRVVAEIPLVEWGRTHRYRAWADADGSGRFRMRVALPSGFYRATLRSGDSWTVRREGVPDVLVKVAEETVRAGDVVAVPD